MNGLIFQHLHRSQVQDIVKDEGGRVRYHHDDQFLGVGLCLAGIFLRVGEEELLQNVDGQPMNSRRIFFCRGEIYSQAWMVLGVDDRSTVIESLKESF